MAIKPILPGTEMVRAILDGRKTVTRRVIKPQPVKKENLLIKEDREGKYIWGWVDYGRTVAIKDIPYPYKPGDILYVRETWAYLHCSNCNGDIDIGVCSKRKNGEEPTACYIYKADRDNFEWDDKKTHWKPSIHMPKEAARIWLKVRNVKAEPLNNMKVDDAIKEGLNTSGIITNQGIIKYRVWNRMQELWNSTIKKKDLPLYGWDANPYVWVIEFERIEMPEVIK